MLFLFWHTKPEKESDKEEGCVVYVAVMLPGISAGFLAEGTLGKTTTLNKTVTGMQNRAGFAVSLRYNLFCVV